MPTISLDSFLDKALGSQDEREQPWRRFGLLQNPFPSRAHPIWDVLHNQQHVAESFYAKLREFLRERNTVTLFFTGGNRVGKTHFMEHHRRVLPGKLQDRGVAMPIALVSAQACDFTHLYRQMFEQIDESLRLQAGSSLFQGSVPAGVVRDLGRALPPGDFRRAVESYAQATSDKERMGGLLRQWLACGRLRATQRRELGINDNLDSIAHVLNAFESLVKYLLLFDGQREGLAFRCAGVLLFLDEFELVWHYRRDRRDQFLQSLRAVVDACPQGLFLCVGMATGVGPSTGEVERSYPALFQRLKGPDAVPALVQVGSVVEALDYANAFLEHGRQKGVRTKEELLSRAEIEEHFKQVAPAGSVSQGDFFDRLHNVAERKAASEAPATKPLAR
jgi:hypothetical protein